MEEATLIMSEIPKDKLSKKSIDLLRQAGWSEDRSIDTSQYERLVKSRELEWFPVAAEFLCEFGDLYVVNPGAVHPVKEDWHFDVARAVEYGTNCAPYYGRRLGREVCPIGMASREYLILMMDEEGKVYAGYDESFWFVADSGIEAINVFSEGRKLRKLP